MNLCCMQVSLHVSVTIPSLHVTCEPGGFWLSHVFCHTLCQTEKHLLNKNITWSLVCNKKCAVSVFDWYYYYCTNSVIVCLYDSVLSEKLMSVYQSCLALSTACERPAWCKLLILLFTGKQEEPPLGAEHAWDTLRHSWTTQKISIPSLWIWSITED